MDNKIIIGRMPHYFTLWRVTSTPEITTDNGIIGAWIHYEFIKNFSKDEEKVRLCYPDAEIVDDLKPVDKFITRKCDARITDDCFHSGKFIGESILDCSDMDYIRFVFPSCHQSRNRTPSGHSTNTDIQSSVTTSFPVMIWKASGSTRNSKKRLMPGNRSTSSLART